MSQQRGSYAKKGEWNRENGTARRVRVHQTHPTSCSLFFCKATDRSLKNIFFASCFSALTSCFLLLSPFPEFRFPASHLPHPSIQFTFSRVPQKAVFRFSFFRAD